MGVVVLEILYEVILCVFVIVMIKFWFFVVAVSRSLSFGSFGLFVEYFSVLLMLKFNFFIVCGFMVV